MSPQDRIEVREMLTDIMSGHLEKIDGQYRLITNQLSNIEIQTTKHNNRMSHIEVDMKVLEKEVHEELPHTADGCPQKNVIVELRDNMITTIALKKAVRNTIIITGTIMSVIYALTMLILKFIENHNTII